ncbi:MAG: disulfide oxidoreductase [Bacillota bacterium]
MLITRGTTVEEALAAHPGAADVFESHGCCVADECPEDVLGQAIEDAEYLCHLDDLDALVRDLNALLVGGAAAAASGQS